MTPSSPLRILLTGASGQVGGALRPLLARYTLWTPGRAEFDLAQPHSLAAQLANFKPDLIVNPAAYTAVDKAESERALAYAANAESVEVMARYCAARAIPMIHFSTDYVFDGTRAPDAAAWVETDGTGPLGVYGASKLAGEQVIAASGAPAVVLRTSWVYDFTGKNFFTTMRRLASEYPKRPELRVVNDQWGVPNHAAHLAHVVAQLVDGGPASLIERAGLYHLSAGGRTNWHAFAAHIVDTQASGMPRPPVLAISTAEYPTPAKRPAFSVLDSTKFERAFGITLPSWMAELERQSTRRS